MPKAAWFFSGFLFALALAALLVWMPMRGADASDTPAAAPEAAPAATAPAAPTPGLVWSRQGAYDPLLGACGRLEIDALQQIHYAPCGQAMRLAYLTEGELVWYRAYLAALAPLTYSRGEETTLTLAGKGSRPASAQEQAALADWAEGVYARLMGEEQRANLLAQARLGLMARRGVGIEAIQVLRMEPVRWPDPCLGLREPGRECVRVNTAGFRILLATDGQTFVYRADVYGRVKAEADYAAHLRLPALAP